MNYYLDINKTIRNEIEASKEYLRETNAQIEESVKRRKFFDQLTLLLRSREQ